MSTVFRKKHQLTFSSIISRENVRIYKELLRNVYDGSGIPSVS